MRKPTNGSEQTAIGPRKWQCGGAPLPCQLRRLRYGETRSPPAAAGAGVGLSRSRHRPPTPWIIERSPVPSDGRRVAKAAEADGEEHTCGAEVTSCRRTASSGRRKRSRRGRSDEGCDRGTQRGESPAAVDGGVCTELSRNSTQAERTPSGMERVETASTTSAVSVPSGSSADGGTHR
jgi:hypothetical protein